MRAAFALTALALSTMLVVVAPARGSAAPDTSAPATAASEKAAFYVDVREKRYDAALAAGAAYRRSAPRDDRFALDYAYALLAAHYRTAAEGLLGRLKHSPIASVRTAAARQLVALAPPPSVPVATASPPPFTTAYELLADGDLAGSRDAFKTTLVTHPNDAAAWRQLSYIDANLNDRPGMIDALDHYLALEPNDDRAKLQLAYALLAQGDRAQANAMLRALTHSTDASVAAAATQQLAVGGSGHVDRLNVFGYAENESRFHDTFFGLDARYTLAPTRIEPYVILHFSDDIKASSVPATTILNDDVVILSAGLRTKISPIAFAFVEGGEAQSLTTGHVESDLRYGAALSTRLGVGGFKPQTQIDASITHFSRYVDTIAYGQVAHDFYIGSKIVRGVVGSDMALDTSRYFYNNAIEGIGGVQVRRGGATLRLVGVAGTYLDRGIDPPQRTYTSIRLVLLYGFSR